MCPNQNNIENQIIEYLKKFDYVKQDYKTLDNGIETTYKREIFKRVK